jgi:hypothetical protein
VYRDFTAKEKEFLQLMSEMESPVKVGEITSRLAQKANVTTLYKNRLIRACIISDADFGSINFALPFFREFLVMLKKSSSIML